MLGTIIPNLIFVFKDYSYKSGVYDFERSTVTLKFSLAHNVYSGPVFYNQ